jgi:hypothetical protein
MNCIRYERLIALYIAHDLPAAKSKTIEAHLRSCCACRRFARELEVTRAALKTLGESPLPQDSLTRVRVAAAAAATGQTRTYGLWKVAAAFALAFAVAGALGVGYFLTGRGPAGARGAYRKSPHPSRYAEHPLPQGGEAEFSHFPGPAKRDDQLSVKRGEGGLSLFAGIANQKQHRSVVAALHKRRSFHKSLGARTIATAEMPRPAALAASARLRKRDEIKVKLITDDPHVVIYWLID